MNHYIAIQAIREFLIALGEDPDRPGLKDTPARVVLAWADAWGAGYKNAPDDLVKLFPDHTPRAAEYPMVVVKGIAYFSHCEHHMAPFFGNATIAYIPKQAGFLGLSKFARVVDHLSRRLMTQERLTDEVADFLKGCLSADIAVRLTGQHMCMMSRGISQAHAETVTTALRGRFLSEAPLRAEFLQEIACR